MESFLDAPSVRRATYRLSVANYHQLNEIGLLRQHPRTAELVIEVAVNTEEIDLSKAALYAEAAVTEYWLVEPRTRRITVFRSPGDRSYAQSTVYEGAQTLACAALPAFEVHLPSLFA